MPRKPFHGNLLERRDSVLWRLRIRQTGFGLRRLDKCLAPIRKPQAAAHADLIFGA